MPLLKFVKCAYGACILENYSIFAEFLFYIYNFETLIVFVYAIGSPITWYVKVGFV